jgi:hypothetical protein
LKLKAPRMLIFALLCAAGTAESPALAADFQITPSLSLSEEFNDNINETATDERSDFVTRIRPGVVLLYRTPSLSGDLGYTFDYRNYARGSRSDEKVHDLAARGSAALLDNFFYLDLSDTFRRVSLDVARDVTTETLFRNQTDQNIAVISPYLLWHPGGKSQLKTGYRFTDTRYWGIAGNISGIDKQEHRVFTDLSYDPIERLNLSAGYAFSSVDTDIVSYDQHDIWTGLRYEYAENSFFFGGIGNSWQSFSDTRSASNLFWNAGIKNDFRFLVTTLETKVQYTEDPLTASTKETSHSVKLEKTLEHGSIGCTGSYSDFDDTFGADDRRRTAFSGFGRYEISPRLTATFAATGDKVGGATVNDYPYHLSGSAGVSYGFNYDITASLSYGYVDYRREWDSTAGARQTNRVVVEVRKVF